MISLEPAAGLGASFVSKTVKVGEPFAVTFAVQGLTAGTVTFQYSTDLGTNWYPLDATYLTATADFQHTIVWGGAWVRAIGDASVAGANLDVLIDGPYVQEVPE